MKTELKSLPTITALGAIAVAILGLFGYLPGLGALGSIREDYIPMAPSTAVSFIILGFILLILKVKKLSRAKAILPLIATLLVSLFGILEVAGHFSGMDLNFENMLVPDAGTLNGIPIARMSPATGAAFFFSGVAVFLLILQRRFPERNTITEYFAGGLGILVLLISFVFCLAYFYGTPLLYGHGTTIPMALTTAVGFMFLSISILTLEKDAFPLRLLIGSSTRSYLLRFILPLSILSVIVGEVTVFSLTQISSINPAFILAVLTVLIAMLTGVVATLISRYMGGAIDRAEAAAKQYNEALRESETKFRNYVETSQDLIWECDSKGRFIYLNPAWEQVTGYKLSEMLGKPFTEFTKEGEAEKNVAEFEKHLRGGSVKGYASTYISKDGSEIFLIFNAIPLRDSNKNIIGTQGSAYDITERELDEENLKQSEERFRKLTETAFEGIVIVDKNKILEASLKFARLFGYEPSEVIGMLATDFIAPDYRDLVIQNILKDYEKPYEAVGLRKDGSTFPFEAHGIKTPYHGITARLTAIHDITERKQAEEKLHESAKRLKDMADSQPALIWGAGTDALCNYFNKTWLEYTGRTLEQELGNRWAEGVHKDDLERCLDIYQSAFKARIPFEMEYRLRRANGEYGWVFDRGVPQYDLKGEFTGYIGTCMDVTARKQAEKALQRSNQSLRALSACNEVLVRAKDEAELLGKVCRIITDIAGYSLAWVGLIEHDKAKTIRPVAQAGYEEGNLKTVKLTWADTERGHTPASIAIRTGRANVTRNTMTDHCFEPWQDEALKREYRASIALPLKDKEQAFGILNIYASEVDAFDEEEVQFLQKLADDLAYGIMTLRSHKERHQLNKQLRQAQKMETIGQLTGGIAHDFNNILASIMGYTELAQDHFGDKGSGKLAEYLREVQMAGERARDLIAQMLLFSRAEGGKPSNVSVAPIVKEAVKMLEPIIPSNIDFESVIGTSIKKVCIDPGQMQQIVFNLCINARDAISGSGAIKVLLKKETHVVGVCVACRRDFDGEFVELCVTDTGEGIAPEMASRIFDPFFSTKDIGKGTGMGLSTIQSIVHSTGGHILVETLTESGTTFRLLLPTAELANNLIPENNDKSLDKKTGNKSSEQDAVQENAHVLVVDDEPSVCGFISDYFRSRGHTVAIEHDGQAALASFRANPDQFDIVITDQTMPKMTGLEMSKEMLKIRKDLPIVLCTGYSEKVDVEVARDAGIGAFLMKPIVPSELQRIVEELLQKSRAH